MTDNKIEQILQQMGAAPIHLPEEIKSTRKHKIFKATSYVFNKIKVHFLSSLKFIVNKVNKKATEVEEKLGIKINMLDKEVKATDFGKIKVFKVPGIYLGKIAKSTYNSILNWIQKPIEGTMTDLDKVLENLRKNNVEFTSNKNDIGVTIVSSGDNNYLFDANGKMFPNLNGEMMGHLKGERDNLENKIELSNDGDELKQGNTEHKIESDLAKLIDNIGDSRYEKRTDKDGTIIINYNGLQRIFDSNGKEHVYDPERLTFYNNREPISDETFNNNIKQEEIKSKTLQDEIDERLGVNVKKSTEEMEAHRRDSIEAFEPTKTNLQQTIDENLGINLSLEQVRANEERNKAAVETFEQTDPLVMEMYEQNSTLKRQIEKLEEKNKILEEQILSRIEVIESKVDNVISNTDSIDLKTDSVKDVLGTVLQSIGAQLQMNSDMKHKLSSAQLVTDTSAIQYAKEQ